MLRLLKSPLSFHSLPSHLCIRSQARHRNCCHFHLYVRNKVSCSIRRARWAEALLCIHKFLVVKYFVRAVFSYIHSNYPFIPSPLPLRCFARTPIPTPSRFWTPYPFLWVFTRRWAMGKAEQEHSTMGVRPTPKDQNHLRKWCFAAHVIFTTPANPCQPLPPSSLPPSNEWKRVRKARMVEPLFRQSPEPLLPYELYRHTDKKRCQNTLFLCSRWKR